MKDIINENNKGQCHGYKEWYYPNGQLRYKGFYNNGIRVDYEEFYYWVSRKLRKSFYI